MVWFRPVGSGAAWRRSPHQKSAGREREKEEKGGKKEKRGERKVRGGKERKGEESKRERCIRPMGVHVKHPLEMSKDYKHDKRHEKGGLNLKKKKNLLKSRKR